MLGSGPNRRTHEFLGADRVVETVGPKRVLAQGLYNYYAKTVWPVKVELRVACESGSTTSQIQEFELEYDDDSTAWKVDSSRWSPWLSDPTENDIFKWEFLAALISALAAGFGLAVTQRPDQSPGRVSMGAIAGLTAGFFVTVPLGIFVGLTTPTVEGTPGIGTALTYGFVGLFIGFLVGIPAGCAGGFAASLLRRETVTWRYFGRRRLAGIGQKRLGEMVVEEPHAPAGPQVLMHDEPHFELEAEGVRAERARDRDRARRCVSDIPRCRSPCARRRAARDRCRCGRQTYRA